MTVVCMLVGANIDFNGSPDEQAILDNIQLRQNKESCIERWEQYDLSWLEEKWLTESEGLINPSNLHLAARELKRFISLPAFYFSGENFVPSAQVDKAWHPLILTTPTYRRICDDLFGKFIDHIPRRPTDPPDDTGFNHTLNRYREIWGEPPPEMWSPILRAKQSRPYPLLLPSLGFITAGLLLLSLSLKKV